MKFTKCFQIFRDTGEDTPVEKNMLKNYHDIKQLVVFKNFGGIGTLSVTGNQQTLKDLNNLLSRYKVYGEVTVFVESK